MPVCDDRSRDAHPTRRALYPASRPQLEAKGTRWAGFTPSHCEANFTHFAIGAIVCGGKGPKPRHDRGGASTVSSGFGSCCWARPKEDTTAPV